MTPAAVWAAAPLSNLASLAPFAPEAILSLGTLMAVALALAGRAGARRAAVGVTVATCVAALAVVVAGMGAAPRALFGGLMIRDRFADAFKLVFLTATALVALLARGTRDTFADDAREADAPEFHALLLGAALGMCLMAAAADLLIAYLSLELLSLASYILAGFSRRSRRSAEASLKYVIYGGVASGAMLYGMSLLYGLAGSTELATVRVAIAGAPSLTSVIAVALLLAGLGFKVTAVPFHMWAPDVYEGAPTAVSGFLAVASKAAGFALLLRIFGTGVWAAASAAQQALVVVRGPLALLFCVAAVATMTLGNLAAMGQRNVKRLLAYSSVAHAGYMLMALAAATPGAAQAALFYAGVYLFMTLGAFAVVLAVADRGGGETLTDYAGLGVRAPFAAACMTAALFSLIGLPPFAGFVGKYYLFAAVVARGLQGGGAPFYLLAVIGVLNSVASLYYYARVLHAMYLQPAPAPVTPLRLSRLHQALLAALTIPTVALGIYWSPWADLVAHTAR